MTHVRYFEVFEAGEKGAKVTLTWVKNFAMFAVDMIVEWSVVEEGECE